MKRLAVVFALVIVVVPSVDLNAGSGCFGWRATQTGSNGPDFMQGDHGGAGPARRDVILGRGGNDAINGLKRKDRICGGPGDDAIIGGDGTDRAHGGPGSDACDAEFQRKCEA